MSNLAYGTFTITNLSTVTSVDVYYYNSTSSTSLSGGSWSTDTPTWANNKYIWSKTVTTWEQGVTTQSEPVCITGQKGSTGATGQSVTKITQQYALSTSSTTAPSTGWSTTMPAFESGKFYWTRSEIVWANPTSTTYTTAVLANGITSANTNAETAKTDAASAVSTANTANQTANTANQTANTANQTAQNAVSVANGKSTIYYSNSKPTGGTYKAGDTWFFLTEDGYRIYEYDTTSSDWVQKSMDGKSITAGTVTAAQIQAGAITTNKLATNAIKSTNYQAGTAPYSNAGTFLDLSNGNIYSPNFGINNTNDNITDGAYIKGSIYAYNGTIGQSNTNYWYIGNYRGYDQQPSAYIKGNGTATIQLGSSNTWRLNTNRIHTAWNENKQGGDDYKLHYPVYNSKYWDMGLHVPTSKTDKFIYIRNSSSSTSLTNLQNNINDQTNGTNNYWNYQFYITSEGILSAKSLKTINNTFEVTDGGSLYARNIYIKDQNGALTQIGGTDAAYLSKTGGIITGDLTVGNATPGDDQQYNGNLRVIGDFLNRSGNNITLQTNLASTAAAALTGNSTSPISIGVTGTLPTSNGGTGNTSYNAGGVVYADGSSPKKLLSTAAGTSGYLLKSGGTGAPTWVDPGTLTVAAATKATQDGDGNVIKTTYLKLTGGNITGPVSFGDSVTIDDLNTGALVVTGNASFTNNIQANTINNVEVGSNPKFTDTITTITTEGSGNAITAIEATNGALKAIKGSNFLMGITSQNIINALGYTPYNAATNPSGYTTNTGTVTSVRVQASSPLQSSVSSAQSSSLNTTISFINQNANVVLAGPSSGNAAAPTFRALVAADIPSLTKSKISDFPTSLKNPNSLNIKIFNGSSIATTTAYDGSVSNQSINVAGTNAITSINSTTDGKLQLTLADGSKPDPISIKITATTSDSASMANKLNLSQNVGSASKPVYFDANTGLPKEISYTIQSNVPQNAVFTDTKYSAGTGLSLNGTTFNHSNSITAGTIGSSSATSSTDRTIVIPYITYDAQGHIIASGTHTHTLDSFPEAYLSWGGKNFSDSYGPIDAAMVPELGANRLAFLKASGITIEYSTNGGSTWTNYNLTDVQKTGIFAKGTDCYLGNASTKANNNINNQLKITINTASNVYTVLNKIAIYMNTNGNTTQVKIEKATHANPTSFSTHLDWTNISGWSGWNILNISDLTTYGNSNNQYQIIVFTFKQTAINTNYPSAIIKRIMGFGGVGWTIPSNMAADGHLYNYDNEQNATFPAQITATQFNGKLNDININAVVDSFNTGGWSKLNGLLNSSVISVGQNSSKADWNANVYSSSLVFGCRDTKGLLDIAYSTPIVTFGGTNIAQATEDRPKWYFKLSGTSDKTYTLPSDSKTLAATDGSNATGTWGISITGNAANVTGTVAVGHGGTGATSFTSGALLIGNGSGAIGTRTIKNMTAKGNLGWTSQTVDIYIPTINTLAYWDGRFNGSNSNLTYCVKGAFGDAAIKGVVTTLDGSANLPTAGAVKTYVDTTAQNTYVTLSTTQTITGRKTFNDLAAVTFKPSSGTDNCSINYDATLGALVFSF